MLGRLGRLCGGRLTDTWEIRQTDTCYTAGGACQALRLGRTLDPDGRFALMCVATVRPMTTPPRKEVRMNLTISGHHLEVSPALREYVRTKLDRVFNL